jgi:hypothetical protein
MLAPMSPRMAVKPNMRRVRFPGIGAHARILKVRREYLWMVLTGRAKSAKLTKRYRAMISAEKDKAKTQSL